MDLSSIESRLKNRNVKVLGHEQMKVSSVLVPLIEKEDGLHVLFQVRGKKLRTQPGEICFPGGRVENEDKNETAVLVKDISGSLVESLLF